MSVPGLYDFELDGVGYLIEWGLSASSFGFTGNESYRKIGRDLLVDREDSNVEEMTENKIDNLFWSSQRSWFGGAKQRRLDDPIYSSPERYLRSKNVDPFTERGELTLSHAIVEEAAAVAGGGMANGWLLSCGDCLAWASPDPGTPTDVILREIANWGDVPTDRGTGLSPTSTDIQGLACDGKYLYISHETKGVFRGEVGAGTDLTVWAAPGTPANFNGAKSIAFVKSRLMGWTKNGDDKIEVWEFDPGATTPTPALRHTHEAGFDMNSGESNPDLGTVFAEVGGFIAWTVWSGQDGYLFLWDGENAPFKAARFPGFRAWAIASYAESILYVLGRDKAGVPATDRIALIRCDVTTGGGVSWDILHEMFGSAGRSFAVQSREIFFPTTAGSEETGGLSADAGKPGAGVNSVSSLNVANDGLCTHRFWGITDGGSITEELPGVAERPAIAAHNGVLCIADRDGRLLREDGAVYAPTGELISSQLDYNIDSDKRFILGEVGSNALPAGTELHLDLNKDDTLAGAWSAVCESNEGDKISRERAGTGGEGVLTAHLHYRLRLVGDTATPAVRKAGFGSVYGRKPTYSHLIAVKAYDRMELRNGVSHPNSGVGLADSIQSALETLRDTLQVVDFREPTGSGPARAAVKVRVGSVDVSKRYVPNTGFTNIVYLGVEEIPS